MIKVENGEEAIAELGKREIDLFITDLKMPGMSAFEIMPIIDRDYPKLPMVVISENYDGLMGNSHGKKGFMNVKRFFLKPLSMDVLKKNVKEVLNF
jgi:YesN/AraC family two-component response regulator